MKDDHRRAEIIGETLEKCGFVEDVVPIETNIIIFKLNGKYSDNQFLQLLEDKGILAVGFGPQTIRFVTHLDFTDAMLEDVIGVLRSL